MAELKLINKQKNIANTVLQFAAEGFQAQLTVHIGSELHDKFASLEEGKLYSMTIEWDNKTEEQ